MHQFLTSPLQLSVIFLLLWKFINMQGDYWTKKLAIYVLHLAKSNVLQYF